MVKGAPQGLNWLMEAGAKIKETLPRIGGHSAHRTHLGAKSQGRGFIEALKKLVISRGAEIRLNTCVTHIWRENADTPVVGVEAMMGDKRKNIRVGRALVLASGGYSRDVKMRMDFNPSLVLEYNCTNHRGATGEMIRYARAIGADVLHMEFIQLYPCAEPRSGAIDTYALHPVSGTGYGLFYVNKFGKRFVNELERRDVVSNAQIKSGGKPTFAILNREMFERLDTPEEEINKGVANGRLIEAESIADLAKKLGIPEDTVQDSATKHNVYISRGSDPDFNKPVTRTMIPLLKGPFYGIAQWPAIHYCMGVSGSTGKPG
jgi:urocanate reductase